MKKSKILFHSYETLLMLLSSFIRAVSMHVFIVPNEFAPGGVSGISSMIQYKFPAINAGYSIFVLNLPLLVLAWIFLNHGFALKTLATTVVCSALLILFEKVAPQLVYQDDRFLAAVAGGIIFGAGLSLMYKIGGSTGGTDIIANLIIKKSSNSVQTLLLIMDGAVVLASFFVYDFALTPVLLALTCIFVSSKVSEAISRGLSAAFKFEIITDSPEELSQILMKALDRGVTCIPAIGMYTGEEKSILVCIVRKRQIPAFQKVLREQGRDTFAYITMASEVKGKGFSPS